MSHQVGLTISAQRRARSARTAGTGAGHDGEGPGGKRRGPVRRAAPHALRADRGPPRRCRRQHCAHPPDDPGLRRPVRREVCATSSRSPRRESTSCSGPARTTPERPTTSSRLSFLRSHLADSQVFYAHAVGRTLEQVRDEARLRLALEDYLDQRIDFLESLTPHQVREEVIDFVAADPDAVVGPAPGPRARALLAAPGEGCTRSPYRRCWCSPCRSVSRRPRSGCWPCGGTSGATRSPRWNHPPSSCAHSATARTSPRRTPSPAWPRSGPVGSGS